MLWKSRPHEFCIPVKIGRFRYRENIHHLNVEAKTWVIIPADACEMSPTKSVDRDQWRPRWKGTPTRAA
jgi:hypothetical protein